MLNLLFVGGLALCFVMVWKWAFRSLPDERWQIMASVPMERNGADTWRGLNLTYYGLIVGLSAVVGLSGVFILLASVGAAPKVMILLACLFVGICMPAAKFIAVVVEKKKHTLTIGGASFLGFLIAPAVAWAVDRSVAASAGSHVPLLPGLAALAVGYALGEGTGRMACISFGCCYGKPFSECPKFLARLVGGHGFIFSGETKKVSYEGGLDGTEVVPIQAVTSVVYIVTALVGFLLYLWGWFSAALIGTVVVTQAWRAYSETLRADYRGEGKVSSYQIMACAAIVYTVGLGLVLPASKAVPDLLAGLTAMWDPGVILFLQIVGVAIFLYTGRSGVTGSTMSFHVLRDRV